MRIHVTHKTVYTYDEPPNYLIQILRLTPRAHDGQYVSQWRLDIDAECRLIRDEDPFGNIIHTFSVERAPARMTVIAEGAVETREMNGIVQGTAERLPLEFYLRTTDLTSPDPQLREFTLSFLNAARTDPLATLHQMMLDLHRMLRFDTKATTPTTSATEAFSARHGVCQDFAQIFIASARLLGLPARFVGGYLLRDDGRHIQEAGHAWAEAFIANLGWVGFDPANGICITENYVRIATGLDSLDATPVRGVRRGGKNETMDVSVTVEPVKPRSQQAIKQPQRFAIEP